MTGYTIGTRIRQTHGHGDFGEYTITGAYYSGNFPPVFLDEAKALGYLASMPFMSDKEVVPIEIIE